MFLIGALIVEFLFVVFIQKKSYPIFDASTSVISRFLRKYFLRVLHLIGYIDISHLVYKHRLLELPIFETFEFVIVFLAVDLGYYWSHRMSHQMRIFWLSHSIHHLPKQLMIVRSAQQSLSGVFLSPLFIASIPMCLLGVPPAVFWIMYGLNTTYQEFLHNEFIPRLHYLEFIFNTPAQHRIHHSVQPQHIDKNFGGVFSFWDRIFGTFHLDNEKIEIYGTLPIVENVTLLTPLAHELRGFKELFKEFIVTKGLWGRIKILFEAPGEYAARKSTFKLAKREPSYLILMEATAEKGRP